MKAVVEQGGSEMGKVVKATVRCIVLIYKLTMKLMNSAYELRYF